MRKTILALTLSLAALGATNLRAQAVAAQCCAVSRGAFEVEGFGGYLITQSFINGPFNTALGSTSSSIYGVQAGLPLAPGAALIGTIGYASGDLKAGLPI